MFWIPILIVVFAGAYYWKSKPRHPLQKTLDRLAKNSTHMVGNAEATFRLQKEGLPFRESLPRKRSKMIKKLFVERRKKALKISKDFPLSPVPESPIIALYDDIRDSIIFGMPGVAIATCGILVEYSLKYCLYIDQLSLGETYDADAWSRYEDKMTFGGAISEALKVGLIDEEVVAKPLRAFKNTVRNCYSHYNILKITRGAIFRNVQAVNNETGEVTTEDIEADRSPAFQLIAKQVHDQREVFRVFEFADSVVRFLFSKVEERQKLRKAV
jgi:hypothetical protein